MPAATLEPPAKAPQEPPVAPEAAPKVNIPKVGAKAPAAPSEKKPEPPAKPTPAGELPDIDTKIMPGVEKSPAKYAEERRQAKEAKVAEKLGVPEMEAELTRLREFETRAKPWETELEQERQRAKEHEARVTELTARQQELTLQATQAQERYYDDFKAEFNPADDDLLRTSHQSMVGTLMSKMPVFVPGADGQDQRVLFNKVMEDPQKAHKVEMAMDIYAKAQAAGNTAGMDDAVNLMLQATGAPVKFSTREEERFLYDSGLPAFQVTEQAMREALPSFAQKQQRSQFVSEQAPVLVQQQITARETSIRDNLRTAIFLDSDARAAIASRNPLDSGVIIADILEHSPQLKESLNGWIAANAPAMARMGKINMPTLASNDLEAIKAHRQEAQRHQQNLGESMRKAAIGHVAGPIIAQMMGELTALRARVEGIAEAENPGGTREGESRGGGDGPLPEIDTKIVK